MIPTEQRALYEELQRVRAELEQTRAEVARLSARDAKAEDMAAIAQQGSALLSESEMERDKWSAQAVRAGCDLAEFRARVTQLEAENAEWRLAAAWVSLAIAGTDVSTPTAFQSAQALAADALLTRAEQAEAEVARLSARDAEWKTQCYQTFTPGLCVDGCKQAGKCVKFASPWELRAENARIEAQVAETRKDTERLDWLDLNGKIAENNPTARVFAIAAFKEWTLREAIDAAMRALSAPTSEP